LYMITPRTVGALEISYVALPVAQRII